MVASEEGMAVERVCEEWAWRFNGETDDETDARRVFA
jgi:hypothetical protein